MVAFSSAVGCGGPEQDILTDKAKAIIAAVQTILLMTHRPFLWMEFDQQD